MKGLAYILGVDAGGSKTRVEAMTLNGQTIAVSHGGPANVLLGLEAATHAVLAAVADCMDAVLLAHPGAECLFLAVGLAGAQSEGVPQALEAAFGARLKIPCHVVTDVALAFAAAHPDGDGLLVIAGTGSIAYGRKGDLMLRRGGWGHLLGDEGSGYAIAVAGIRAALRTLDEGEPEGQLGCMLREAWSAPTLRGVVDAVYARDKAGIATLSRVVEVAADAGDADAIRILEEAGTALAELALGLSRRLGMRTPSVAYAGSILVKSERVRAAFAHTLQQRLPGACLQTHPVDPVRGALTLCRKRDVK